MRLSPLGNEENTRRGNTLQAGRQGRCLAEGPGTAAWTAVAAQRWPGQDSWCPLPNPHRCTTTRVCGTAPPASSTLPSGTKTERRRWRPSRAPGGAGWAQLQWMTSTAEGGAGGRRVISRGTLAGARWRRRAGEPNGSSNGCRQMASVLDHGSRQRHASGGAAKLLGQTDPHAASPPVAAASSGSPGPGELSSAPQMRSLSPAAMWRRYQGAREGGQSGWKGGVSMPG